MAREEDEDAERFSVSTDVQNVESVQTSSNSDAVISSYAGDVQQAAKSCGNRVEIPARAADQRSDGCRIIGLRVRGSAERLHVLYRARWASAFDRSGSACGSSPSRDSLGSLSHELGSYADGGIGIRGLACEPADPETHLATSQSSGDAMAARAGVIAEDEDRAFAVRASGDHPDAYQHRRGHAL